LAPLYIDQAGPGADPPTAGHAPNRAAPATGIPEERCRRIHLDYLDPATVDAEEWKSCCDWPVVP
jgi:hypothetical protein